MGPGVLNDPCLTVLLAFAQPNLFCSLTSVAMVQLSLTVPLGRDCVPQLMSHGIVVEDVLLLHVLLCDLMYSDYSLSGFHIG